MIQVEICTGGYRDGLIAAQAGAKRIELNSALSLGGLTAQVGDLCLLKKKTNLEIIGMVRVRDGGFYYTEEEHQAMLENARLLLENGADGIAFGYLNKDCTIDVRKSREMVDLIHQYKKTAVFHRAIDLTPDLLEATRTLVEINADRILTSGGRATALAGKETIKAMVINYGSSIEIMAGSGISGDNAKEIIRDTGVTQIHASCKIPLDDQAYGNAYVSFEAIRTTTDGTNVKHLLEAVYG